MRRTTRLLPAAALAAFALVGCTTPDPTPTPPPTSDATPVFASDEEALAAAEEAYGEYLATVDAIFADGGADPERLLKFVTRDQYEVDLQGFDQLRDAGLRGTGTAAFVLSFQSFDASTGDVTAYSCDDLSETDVIDASGKSVVGAEREVLVPYEVSFSGMPLRIASRTIWEGTGVCA